MTESVTYSVVLSGDIRVGYETELVVNSFAKMFKLPLEKAAAVVGTKRTLKKEVDQETAELYKQKLRGIGLEVILERHGPPVVEETEEPSQALSLQAMEDPEPAESNNTNTSDGSDGSSGARMECPKCGLEQPKAEECSGCGVIIEKARIAAAKKAAEEEAKAKAQEQEAQQQEDSEESYADDEGGNYSLPKVLAVPALVAVVGALLWWVLAVTLEREFGLVAWIIGAAVGGAGATFGARGNVTGIVCAVLVLLSIFGGKYLAASSFQAAFAEELAEEFSANHEEILLSYREEMRAAEQFENTVIDDESLRRFMVNYDYSESYEKEGVTSEEIALFKQYDQPKLVELAQKRPSFDEWQAGSIAEVENYSTMTLLIESLGAFDLLFLLLGLGTAFKVGRGEV